MLLASRAGHLLHLCGRGDENERLDTETVWRSHSYFEKLLQVEQDHEGEAGIVYIMVLTRDSVKNHPNGRQEEEQKNAIRGRD